MPMCINYITLSAEVQDLQQDAEELLWWEK